MYCLAQLVRNSKKPPGLESRWPSLILPAFCDSVGTVRTYLAQESRNLALKIRGATGSGNARALLLGSSLVEVGSARVSGAGSCWEAPSQKPPDSPLHGGGRDPHLCS